MHQKKFCISPFAYVTGGKNHSDLNIERHNFNWMQQCLLRDLDFVNMSVLSLLFLHSCYDAVASDSCERNVSLTH